jgi:hypothetical protein
MKLYFSCFAIAVFFSPLHGQSVDADIPASVKISFMEHFLTATDEEWSMSEGGFKVKFKHQGFSKTAIFSNDGTLSQLYTSLFPGNIPVAIKDLVTNACSNDCFVEEILLAETSGSISYLVRLTSDEVSHSVLRFSTFTEIQKN